MVPQHTMKQAANKCGDSMCKNVLRCLGEKKCLGNMRDIRGQSFGQTAHSGVKITWYRPGVISSVT